MKRALILSGGGARGAFQVGVWQYLKSIGWEPDIICGSSIGAINAVAIGSGLSLDALVDIWLSSERKDLFRTDLGRFATDLVFRRGKKIPALMDTTLLRSLLESRLDFARLRNSRYEILVSAVEVESGAPRFFDQSELTVEHIMASSAMPLIFPPQKIGDSSCWDGGTMVNTPVMPAIERGADEIVVVLPSPVGSGSRVEKPAGVAGVLEHLMEEFLISSYLTAISAFTSISTQADKIKIVTVAPSRMLGLKSLLHFSAKEAELLIDEGFERAKDAFSPHVFKAEPQN